MSSNLSPTLLTRLKDNSLAPGGLFHLDLSSSNIGPADLILLGEVIKHNGLNCEGSAPLVSIELCNNVLCGVNSFGRGFYDADGLNEFCNHLIALKNVSRLKKLDLSRNYLQTKGMQAITNLFSSGFHSLTELSLRSCQLTSESMERFALMLATNRSLQYLDLSENALGPIGGQMIGESLGQNVRLRHLLLNSCDLLAEGVLPICHAVTINNNLEMLCLNDNGFGDTGAEAIGNCLKANGKLRTLDIQENGIGYEGICAIAKGLTKNHTLQFLGLQWNDIGNDGAERIGEALGLCNSLTAIHILGNYLDIEGIKAIISGSLKGSTRPVDLDLSYTYRRGKMKTERKVLKELPTHDPQGDAATLVSNLSGGGSETTKNQK